MKIEVEDKESNSHGNRLAVMLIDVQESLLAGIKNKNKLLDALNILIQSTNFFLC